MSFRPLPTLLALALGLALAPVARAQGSYPTTPVGWATPPAAYGYYVPQPVAVNPAPSWVLSAEGGKLQVQTADGTRASCASLTIPVGGAVEVTAEGKQVHVRSGPSAQTADALRGDADRVSRSGPDGVVLTLEGHAKLTVVRNGKRAEVASDRIAVNLATGHVEADLGVEAPAPTAPVLCPVNPSSPPPGSTPGPRAAEPDDRVPPPAGTEAR
jgi:hypothetical protein